MPTTPDQQELVQLESQPDLADNGAPAREPEVWDERIDEFNPLFGHTPEPSSVTVSPELAARVASDDFDVVDFLGEERTKDLLRFSTAGVGRRWQVDVDRSPAV